MNDVKITDVRIIVQGGDLYLTPRHKYMPLEIPEWAVAALRAHFAAEQPAPPTPSTEQIAAALDAYRSRLEEEDPAIQRLNKTDPYVVASIFNQGYQAALVSPVSEQPTPEQEQDAANLLHDLVEFRDTGHVARFEQPTPLDPEPPREWHDTPHLTVDSIIAVCFNPGSEYTFDEVVERLNGWADALMPSKGVES